jgi:hypothetical protein
MINKEVSDLTAFNLPSGNEISAKLDLQLNSMLVD